MVSEQGGDVGGRASGGLGLPRDVATDVDGRSCDVGTHAEPAGVHEE